MASADDRYRIVFNGEIYNYRELKRELSERGRTFRTESDTEVILEGFAEWGEGVVERLRGMFAFALYDTVSTSAFLARDPLGIKPLYYAETGDELAFASEVRALAAALPGPTLDPQGVASFLTWGSIPPPSTVYREIRALPAGHLMKWSPQGGVEVREYWRLESELGRSESMDAVEAMERVRAALVDTVSHHAIADVPVGAFLSGGVDSAALVGLLGEVTESSVRSVNLSFDEASLDESALAAHAAETYGSDHLDVPIRIEEIRERLPDAIDALDQPSIDGINTYFVSEASVAAGLKVAVSGVGGDELFGGYLTFQRIPKIRRIRDGIGRVPGANPLIRRFGPALGAASRGRRAPKMIRSLVYGAEDAGAYFAERGLFSPAEIRRIASPDVAEALEASGPAGSLHRRLDLGAVPPEERISALEIRQYLQSQLLRDTDAMSMRHSLEVDIGLLRDLMKVPARYRLEGPAKKMLRSAPAPPVPDRLWNRRKQGFTLPFERWIRDGSIAGAPIRNPLLRPEAVDSIRTEVLAGRTHWSRLWALVVLDHFAS